MLVSLNLTLLSIQSTTLQSQNFERMIKQSVKDKSGILLQYNNASPNTF